jgi:hypothetical protein
MMVNVWVLKSRSTEETTARPSREFGRPEEIKLLNISKGHSKKRLYNNSKTILLF